ncbi:MAG: NUDIX hydrolase [Herminiimonas sp.]|nr:NUDIX hydrolase [Herminiimonas sp.]
MSRASCGTDIGYTRSGHWGRAGAGLLILSPNRDQVALFMRSSEVDDAGLWGIPGGARGQMEDGSLEAPLITALSEAREELKCVPQGRLWTAPARFVHPDRQFAYDTHVIVLYDKDIFTPRLNWEHTEFSWHAIDDAKSNPQVHPGVRFSLDRLNGKSGRAGETNTTPWTTQPQSTTSSSQRTRDQAARTVAWCKRVMPHCV